MNLKEENFMIKLKASGSMLLLAKEEIAIANNLVERGVIFKGTSIYKRYSLFKIKE